MNSELHDMLEPTRWAEAPDIFSFTSLQSIGECPRRWQLSHSAWGPHPRFPVRPNSAALEGQVVHEELDRLARALGRHGRPAIGTPEFQEALSDCDFWGSFTAEVAELNEVHADTVSRNVIRTSPRELANRAIRLFRASYVPGGGARCSVGTRNGSPGTDCWLHLLRTKSALSEVRLTHPSLPFTGVVDLVFTSADGRTTVLDHKTGKHSNTHMAQVIRYALLWWRETSDIPGSVAVQYLDDRQTRSVDVSMLEQAEWALAGRIQEARDVLALRPAPPRSSAACAHCPVRARCDEGWAVAETANDGNFLDLEITVDSEVHETGFMSQRCDGSSVPVVFDAAVGRRLPAELGPGDRLRLVSAFQRRSGDKITEAEIRATTEVFRLPT